ncbi:MAG: hypothetical protein IPI11_18470 [Haliscomenobacter sp.]|nr:hypothetical protein [Haliscomenobacter sp.]
MKSTLLESTANSRYHCCPFAWILNSGIPSTGPSSPKGLRPLAVFDGRGVPVDVRKPRIPGDAGQPEPAGYRIPGPEPQNRMIVVADGNLARNGVDVPKRQVITVGVQPFCSLYLRQQRLSAERGGVSTGRFWRGGSAGKNVDLRLLDTAKAKAEKGKWRLI